MKITPNKLLLGMYWSFAEPVPESPRSFIVAARAYAADIAAPDPSEALEAQLPISDIRIRHENWTQGSDGGWLSSNIDVRIGGHSIVKLTGAELLWKIHLSCANTVGKNDNHFFEGLELETEVALNEPPLYKLLLGS